MYVCLLKPAGLGPASAIPADDIHVLNIQYSSTTSFMPNLQNLFVMLSQKEDTPLNVVVGPPPREEAQDDSVHPS